MKVGLLVRADREDISWLQRLGLRSMQWVRFAESPCVEKFEGWESEVDAVQRLADEFGITISAIAALYKNPLDPRQQESSRRVFHRAIDVASRLGIKTVSGFCGAVIHQQLNERGGNMVYEPFENHLPEIISYWRPIAQYAADRGVRIAFEHCPQGRYHLPMMGYNFLDRPRMWEIFFNECQLANVGLEWDPSHLICQHIDPLANLKKFVSKVFHVHAKDARINRDLLREYGVAHPGVAEHRFPGLGEADWGEIIRTLLEAGYDSDLTIEGWHDPIYRNHLPSASATLRGKNWEEKGVLIAKETLERFLPTNLP